MSCLGVHFALTDDDVAALLAADGDRARLGYLQELERKYFAEFRADIAESAKAWDAMHRSLSDGSLDDEGGEYPLSHTVLGGLLIYGKPDYIMSLKSPWQVQDIARALKPITRSQFRTFYDRIDADDYGEELSDADFEYTWESLQVVRSLYKRAAERSRHVLFTADQ